MISDENEKSSIGVDKESSMNIVNKNKKGIPPDKMECLVQDVTG